MTDIYEQSRNRAKIISIDGDDYTLQFVENDEKREEISTWFFIDGEVAPEVGDVLEFPEPIWKQILWGNHLWFGPVGIAAKALTVAFGANQDNFQAIQNITSGRFLQIENN